MTALICAPLKVGERVIGVIALGSAAADGLHRRRAEAAEHAGAAERPPRSRTRGCSSAPIQAGARARASCWRCTKEIEVARAKLEREIELAARIQADLFPAALPDVWPDYDLRRAQPPGAGGAAATTTTRCATAGPTAYARLLLCVADVSGKGLPAALLMSNMQATLRALLGRTASLPALAGAGRATCSTRRRPPDKYVTAALVELDPRIRCGAPGTSALATSTADRAEANGDSVRLASTGAPLGLLPPGLPYEETSRHCWNAGDCAGAVLRRRDRGAERSATKSIGEERLHRRACAAPTGQPAQHRDRPGVRCRDRRLCRRRAAVRRHHRFWSSADRRQERK